MLQGKNYSDYKGCPLNIKILTSILGTRNGTVTSLFLKNLISENIIKRVGGYTPGIKSYHYALANKPENYLSITGNPQFTKITDKIITKRNSTCAVKTKELKLYKKYIQRITLDIKENENLSETVRKNYSSINEINKYFNYQMESSISIHNTPMTLTFPETCITKDFQGKKSSKFVNVDRIININVWALQAIIDGDWYVHRINNKSRVYTNLTNLKREFRKLLKYDGKPLIELDIRNSQPLIASILIKNYWAGKGITMPEDVTQYQNDCEAGIFYDYFMKLNNVEVENRSEFKVQLFAEVFFSRVSKRNTILKTQFIEKYPSAYEAICYIKGGMGSVHYNKFAIQLQCKEASIIFDDTNMSLLNDGMPAFNIFDSILCLPENKEIAMERLMQAFAVYGLSPTINYKNH